MDRRHFPVPNVTIHMATPFEFGLLVMVALAALAVYVLLKIVKPLIINAVLGLIVLLAAGFLGFPIDISWVVVLVVAIGGIPGALLVLLLAYFGVLFSPAALAPLVALL